MESEGLWLWLIFQIGETQTYTCSAGKELVRREKWTTMGENNQKGQVLELDQEHMMGLHSAVDLKI